ncbi:MAG: AAA family ATPase [Ktedonobacteraceae bacterium]
MTFEPLSDHFPHPSVPSAAPPPCSPSALVLSDIPTSLLSWLWPARIPLGHLTLLDAAPGCNPSPLALSLAASISSGSPLPDGTPTPQGNVLLFAPYDGASATLKPRLEAAGADPAHVVLLRPTTPTFSLPRDLPQLAAIIRFVDTRLLILDPASAMAGLTRCLPALAELAQQTNCAILLIRSLRTPIADPLRSPAPPSPILEAIRSRLLLTPDPDNENHCLLLTTHHLLCPQPPILAYDTRFSTEGIPTLHWLGEHERAHLARLCTGPVSSPHRQAILHFLQNSPTPQPISAILTATCYDHEAGRKMLIRMKLAGELHSPARGLYTTTHHPSLSAPPTATSPVPNVPTQGPDEIGRDGSAPPTTSSVSNVPTVPPSSHPPVEADVPCPSPHPGYTCLGKQVIQRMTGNRGWPPFAPDSSPPLPSKAVKKETFEKPWCIGTSC